MTASLEHIVACQERLIAALDGRNASEVEAATADLSDALSMLSEAGAVYQADAGLLDHAIRQSEAARIRVNVLADWTRQRIDRLAEIRGQGRGGIAGTYGKPPVSPMLG